MTDHAHTAAHYTALAAQAQAEPVVAYRIGRDIVCLDPLCLLHWANEMSTATPLTQADISEEQQNREGHAVSCESCMVYLDLWNLTMGAQS